MDGGGKTPLDEAIKRKHTEIADLLRKHGAKKHDDHDEFLDAADN